MKYIWKLLKIVGYIVAIPVLYVLVALVLSYIPVNTGQPKEVYTKTVYIHSNGVHLDVALNLNDVSTELKEGLTYDIHARYLSFGWGDENFYLHTPTWGDLTFSTAFKAVFLKSSTLVHFTGYYTKGDDWVAVQVSAEQLAALNKYLNDSFTKTNEGAKIKLDNPGYGTNDFFYKANGYYTGLKTCNTWVNSAFKQCNMKACVWTPFDFPLLDKYR